MFRLKHYQQQTLDVLEAFLQDARAMPVAEAYTAAFKRMQRDPVPYRHYDFAEIPYVCLRLPTGGGKTVLASHAVQIAKRSYLEQEYPTVLWLVPTNAIRTQTLEALKTVGHPYRLGLEEEFGLDRLKVLDIGEVHQVNQQDIVQKAIIVVGTLATLRVNDTSGRRIYAYHEDFEPHFAAVDPNDTRLERVSEADLQEHGLGPSALGKIKYSFANLLALQGPLVIMDEAHNARTSLTFETLKRLHPRCVIEFTATPDTRVTSASNVLYHVSASELKAEEMIKLPIMLTEHEGWQAAVRDAMLTREKLEKEARRENDYLRPIVLYQAEAKNGTVTWQVLKQHLMDELHIPEEKIAVATGKKRELEGLNLFARDCPIEYIITIEALKEGWDCSFAYVFCSVKDVRSSKDAEQLLGRVLRMPYAKRRQAEALNRAYAHLASPVFSQAAQQLAEKLINMGFEAMEVPAYVQHGRQSGLFDDDGVETVPQLPPLIIAIDSKPDLTPLPVESTENITLVDQENGRCRVEVKGRLDDGAAKQFIKLFKGKEKKALQAQIIQHNARVEMVKAPSERGATFARLPQLCLLVQGELQLLEPESFLYLDGRWSLLNFPVALDHFSIRHTDTIFEVDVDNKHIAYHIAQQRNIYDLNRVDAGFTEQDIVRWLDRQVRQPDVPQSDLRAFLSRMVSHLTSGRGMTLTALERSKFLLARAINAQIARYRKQAAKTGFQLVMFEQKTDLETHFDFSYQFKPGFYPARTPFYRGRFRFAKHYYPVIDDLKADGEEFECAKAIDSHPKVRHWVRNLVNREQASFRLPLAKGYFYPDFVAELTDGRLLVVEYKGEVYKTNDDSREKNAVGSLWAGKSGGQCLYLMAVESDAQGRNVYQQIDGVVGE